uniref:Carboxylic ester hydrolase n=1 Tax=Leptinotarsa decemlineata TaxID=7539 RepID=A0A0A7ENS3_LEPDE|nr:esterase [Leptinotarsa decemlineata]
MLYNIFIIFFIINIEHNANAAEDILVQLPIGQIRGGTRKTITGTNLYYFQGVPFAEPPINELRFQAPRPKLPWEGIWDATQERSYCYQMTSATPDGNEDCLFINIFTPQKPSLNGSLPVMFFIYGGGFIEGASVEINYGPDHFMDYGVIIVTFNYRVGPFGFFSTGDDVIPGNNGLKDQLLALKWTNQYIKYFGGDPNKITIFGQSAGAASVTYHILSPKSKGLFKAAICQSGSALSAWAYQDNQKNISYRLASFVEPEFDIHNASSMEVYQYFENVPAEVIDRASHRLYKLENPADLQIVQGFYFAPVVENEHEDAFITKPMYEIWKSGEVNNVPLLSGVNTEESLFYTDSDGSTEAYAADPLLLIPRGMHLRKKAEKVVAESIRHFYCNNGSFLENPRQLIKYFSDQSFARSIIETARLHSRVGDVFFYQFAYHGVLGGQTDKSVEGFSEDVRHGEEISYLFRRNYGGLNTTDLTKYPEMDQIVQKRMIKMFTDFAKYSTPTPEPIDLLQNLTWPKVKPDNFQYLDIGSYLEIKRNPKDVMFKEWKKLFSKYGVPPFYTY